MRKTLLYINFGLSVVLCGVQAYAFCDTGKPFWLAMSLGQLLITTLYGVSIRESR